MPQDTHDKPVENGQGTDEAPKYVTVEDLNKAITARFSAFDKKNKETILEALGQLAPEIDKMIEGKFKAQEPPTPGKPKTQVEDDPKYKGLEKQLQELKQKAESESTARAAAEAKAKDRELRQKVRDALGSLGVDGDRGRHALGFLVDAEHRISWGEDGESLVYKDTDGSELDFSSGMKRWAKSDEAKIYLPPKGVTGSGDRPPAKQSQNGKVSNEELGNAILKLWDR